MLARGLHATVIPAGTPCHQPDDDQGNPAGPSSPWDLQWCSCLASGTHLSTATYVSDLHRQHQLLMHPVATKSSYRLHTIVPLIQTCLRHIHHYC